MCHLPVVESLIDRRDTWHISIAFKHGQNNSNSLPETFPGVKLGPTRSLQGLTTSTPFGAIR